MTRTSPKPIVSLVVAMARNRVIGKDGGLPWRLPDDLKHFKRLTLDHTVIMGRKTFEEIRQPLANRRHAVRYTANGANKWSGDYNYHP